MMQGPKYKRLLESAAREIYYLPWLLIPRIRQRHDLIDYINKHPCRKLILGAGGQTRPGWLSTDGYQIGEGFCYLNLRARFPLDEGVIDYFFCEHAIEHICYDDAIFALSEMHRTLKHHGKLRIATPDMDKIIALKHPSLSAAEANYIEWSNRARSIPQQHYDNACFVINRMFRDYGHKFIYDRRTLSSALEQVGFQVIAFCEPGTSEDPELRDLEHHGEAVGHDNNLVETMVAEAIKP
jgi:predicted SAM-dependent methyltransferase